MVLLCMTWGFQQIAIKAVADDITPLFQIALRSGMAAFLVGSLMVLRRGRSASQGGAEPAGAGWAETWRPGLLVAVLFAAEFFLIGEALRFTTASRTVVFLYTAPIFAALGLHWRLPTERLRATQWLGIGLAFLGIVLAFWRGAPGPTGGKASSVAVWGDCLALLSGLAWASTTVLIRTTRLTNASASKTLLYQLVGAFVLLTFAAVWMGQTGFRQTPLAWSSLLFQGIVVTFASYLIWFWLLTQYLASRLGALSFMTPLFGVLFGVSLLGEPVEARFLAGAAMVLAGIALVNGHEWLRETFLQSNAA